MRRWSVWSEFESLAATEFECLNVSKCLSTVHLLLYRLTPCLLLCSYSSYINLRVKFSRLYILQTVTFALLWTSKVNVKYAVKFKRPLLRRSNNLGHVMAALCHKLINL